MARAMLWAPLAVLAALARLALADIEFTSPKAGDEWEGGTSLEIEWKDSGDEPALTDLTTYRLYVCAGGNEGYIEKPISNLREATPFAVSGNAAQGIVDKDFGDSKPENAYFLKMISTSAKGGTVTNFSKRFTLTGMTGSFSDSILEAMEEIDGTDGPERVDETTDTDIPADPAAGDYDVEYTMQTGPTRYAPMQPQPPTKITKKKATPLYPTSSFTIAKDFLTAPNVQTTITQSQTFSAKSRTNPADPAPMPTDDMEKFLARWKD